MFDIFRRTTGSCKNDTLSGLTVAVTLVAVLMHDLATAVFTGIILSALVFARESSKHVIVRLDSDSPQDAQARRIDG